jgi:nucleoside-diphosphate-sugar epimerase
VIECDLATGVPALDAVGELDAVVHLAQSARYKEFPEGVGDVVAVNVAATAGLLDLARRAGARRFVLASTGGVYAPSPAPLRERDPVDPRGFYAASKYSAELLARSYADLVQVTVLRPFFVYGPAQRPGMLVRELAKRVLGGETVTIRGEQGLVINPIHADDAARAVLAVLQAPTAPAIVNIAGAQTASLLEIVTMLGEAAGREPLLAHEPGDPGSLTADIGVLRDLLNAPPQVALAEGLPGVVAALRA